MNDADIENLKRGNAALWAQNDALHLQIARLTAPVTVDDLAAFDSAALGRGGNLDTLAGIAAVLTARMQGEKHV